MGVKLNEEKFSRFHIPNSTYIIFFRCLIYQYYQIILTLLKLCFVAFELTAGFFISKTFIARTSWPTTPQVEKLDSASSLATVWSQKVKEIWMLQRWCHESYIYHIYVYLFPTLISYIYESLPKSSWQWSRPQLPWTLRSLQQLPQDDGWPFVDPQMISVIDDLPFVDCPVLCHCYLNLCDDRPGKHKAPFKEQDFSTGVGAFYNQARRLSEKV